MARWIIHELFASVPEVDGHLPLSVAFAQLLALKSDADPFDQDALQKELRENSSAQEVLRWMLRLLQSGAMKSASRPVGGGPLGPINSTHWQADDVVPRFLTSQYSKSEPFNPHAEVDSWIFVDDGDFERLWEDHRAQLLGDHLTPKSEARPARKLKTPRPEKVEPSEPGALLSLGEVENLVGLGRTTIYKLVASEGFPVQIKIGSRSLWRRSDIMRWIDDEQSGPTAVSDPPPSR